MAITNYTELTGAVVAWLNIATADVSSIIADVVRAGELRIMREVRTPAMEATLNGTISSGSLSVPSDYIEMKYAYVDGSPTQYLEMVPPSQIYERYPTRSSEGKPMIMARDGSSFIFGPFPDSSYTIKGSYYKRLTALATGTSNNIFDNNPDLYLWACLAESDLLIGRDKRLPIWESKYRMVKELVNGEASRSRLGGNLSMRPG